MDENKLKADAVMLLLNNIVGAFDSGFIDSHTLTISELYRVAQNHVKDTYGVDVKSLGDEWGAGVAHSCKLGGDIPSTDNMDDVSVMRLQVRGSDR